MNLFKNINFDKLKNGLAKTRNKIFNQINETFTGKAVVNESVLDELEEILITSDIGYEIAERVIEQARVSLKNEKDRSKINIIEILKKELVNTLQHNYNENGGIDTGKYKPYVILIVGVNGSGKTTTIGKLAYNFKKSGLNVIIGSADTFRAAANEQLEVWAKRAGVEVIQRNPGSDPGAVAFDTLNIAKKNNSDIVIIDTAGRLHTKTNLMEELKKIRKVLNKVLEYAPNETLLVVDGNTGQNAIVQADTFSKYTELTGLVVTKLDGTAKGGVIFQICTERNLPVKYIGIGEGIDDLQTFDPETFVAAFFDN